jgi:3-hydroxy-3-methylglutaryl CoA synthase
MPERSPAEIRASIEANRQALVTSVDNARNEVARLTDWRGYIAEHKQEITVGAAAVGFLVGSAIVLRGLRRRR